MGVTAELTTIAIGVGVLGAAAAVVSARSESRSSSSVVVRTGIAVAGLGLAGAVLTLAIVPVAAFAVAHLLYLLAVVSLPIVGVGFAVAWVRGRGRRALGVTAVALLLLAPLGIWATHVAPFRLREDRASLALRPGRSLDRPLRVGVLADLQTIGVTEYERSAVDRLMAREPDVILIAGDLFQGNGEQFARTLPAYRAMLGRLRAPGGVYVVRGDVDGDGFDQLIEGTGIEILDDEVTTAEVGDQRVVIGGVRLDYQSESAQAVYDELEAVRGDEPVLLLSHRPDSVLELRPSSRVDLTVAGHTHGGQIALPIVGPPVTLSSVPRAVGAGGLHEVAGNAVYVSTGVGLERGQAPQIRFLTRPSFGVIDLLPPV
ncbi:metallophosphoesterase [Aquihabitans daechungensis]|uniref:metallophosphoesterase n=1 Tax=Aquihabitans daechungensis TaxID=1052257 RepID=UPI003B9EEA8C